MAGQPAGSTTGGVQPDGRTIGLQIASGIGTDDRLMRVALWFESVRGGDAAVDWSRVA
jgi:aspartyl-tRNA(Asn)/glutamyl-tRNA(Gln) amidotransferase subunit A